MHPWSIPNQNIQWLFQGSSTLCRQNPNFQIRKRAGSHSPHCPQHWELSAEIISNPSFNGSCGFFPLVTPCHAMVLSSKKLLSWTLDKVGPHGLQVAPSSAETFVFRGCFEFSVHRCLDLEIRDGYKMLQISYNFPSDHPNPSNSPGLQIIQSDLRLR